MTLSGSDGSFAHMSVVFEELGYAGDMSFGIHVHAIVAHYILNQGTEERIADVTLEPPQALCLSGCQPKSGHFHVFALNSLEHFIDKPRALAEMKRVARPDASFLILVPNADFLTRKLGLYSGTHQVKAREDVFDLATWNRLFEDAGLRVVARCPFIAARREERIPPATRRRFAPRKARFEGAARS